MASMQDKNAISAELSSKFWYEAKQNLSKEEQDYIRDFQGNSGDNHGIVNDVLKTAKEKQKEAQDKNWTFKRSDGRVVVVRELFSKIVDWITKFQGAVDFLVSLDVSGHSALPWAGVKFLLGIAVKDSQKWGSVIAGLEFVTREISYYGIFEVIYLRRTFDATKQLSEELVQAYTKILQFLSGARRYYNQNSLKRFLGTAFSLDDDLSAIVNAIKTKRDDIERLRGMIDGQQEKEMGDGIVALSQDQKENQDKLVGLLNDLAAPMEIMAMQLTDVKDEIVQMRSEMKAKNKADELPKIYAHLQPGKVTSYETKVEDLTPGTATWILRNGTFTEWIEGKIPVLFVSGGPGTGKSHLSTKVIDYLRKTPLEVSRCQIRVGYYYFKDSDKSTRSVLIALCSIIYQMAVEDEIYRMHAAEICDRSPNSAMATCGTVWNDFLVAEYGATSESKLFLVIDGIDEAEREEFTEFLKLLSRSVLQGIRVQILLVGRPEMNSIIRGFVKSPFGTIEVSSTVNIDDIRKFSQARYDELIKVPKSLRGLRHKVTETLTKKADGMFLWVDLIYKEELQEILSPMKLKEALGNLPDSGLTNLYDRIFSRIERDSGPAKHLALQELFSWAAYFKEPLSLVYLNDILHFSCSNQYSDAKIILAETCASLFILVKTGEVLSEEANEEEMAAQNAANSAQEDAEHDDGGGNADPELEEDYDDENYDDEKENAAIAEAGQRYRNHQRNIFVHLRHASLGNYLRRTDLKSTAIILGANQGQVHVVVTMLRIVCAGADAPQELWLYLTANFLDQLRSLDFRLVSEAETQVIVRYLHQIFTSETLGRHIAKVHTSDEAISLLLEGGFMSFGSDTAQQDDNYLVIRKWLQKAQDTGLTKLDPEIATWVGQILNNHLQLLVPLVKTCINEWLACKADWSELYWRFDFISRCIIFTDLIPRTILEPDDGYTGDVWFGDVPISFVASLSEQPKTMEMHFSIAKTMSLQDLGSEMAIAEYQKAIAMAQEQGNEDLLKEIYLQQVWSFVDVGYTELRLAETGRVLEAIENYMKLDDSNAKMIACLGVVRVEMRDNKGAIENFQKSLELNKRDHEVGIALLRTLFKMKDYEAMMLQVEYYGIPTVGSWLRESYSFAVHEEILHAARTVNKVEKVLKCYEHEIRNIQLSDDDLNEVKDADPAKTAQKTLLRRTVRVAISSMLRVYLGGLRLEILGQPDGAFELWKTAFFQRSEFFNLSKLTRGKFTTDIISYFIVRFSQLIYEKASNPDSAVVGEMILHLEHLQRRKRIFQQLDERLFTGYHDNLRNMDLLLAKLYLKHGRKDEARKILNDQFQTAMDILEDEIPGNDSYGYEALAALLFLNGQLEKAELAMSLKRFWNGFDVKSRKRKEDAPEPAQEVLDIDNAERKDGESEVQERPPDKQDGDANTIHDDFVVDDRSSQVFCACRYTCTYSPPAIPYDATIYTCTTCANVNFCETCYDNLRKETNQRKLFVCSPGHDFIKTPPDGLEKIEGRTNMTITMNGKTVSSADWLADVRKEWKTGLCFKS